MKKVDIENVKKRSVNTSIVEAMISLRFAYETVYEASEDSSLKEHESAKETLLNMADSLSNMSGELGKLIGNMFASNVDKAIKEE